MSFGALCANAVRAMNPGAKAGGFAHDTGEGGISRYHLRGRRRPDLADRHRLLRLPRRATATSTREAFADDAAAARGQDDRDQAVPGRQARARRRPAGARRSARRSPRRRGVPEGRTCSRRPTTSAFSTPLEMMAFIAQLRELGGGKPVGFKLCVGDPPRVHGHLQGDARRPGSTPDFIVVDGGEGGTGAAPLEFADHVGMPLTEGLMLVHNTLVGAGLRDRIRIGAAARWPAASTWRRAMAMGADWCNSARAMMFAVGCIQAQRCHTNPCPVGVTTQDPSCSAGARRAGQGRAGAQLPARDGGAAPRRSSRRWGWTASDELRPGDAEPAYRGPPHPHLRRDLRMADAGRTAGRTGPRIMRPAVLRSKPAPRSSC